ncbi:hypothetical protein ACLOJK_038403, partial [Asimina triloba]
KRKLKKTCKILGNCAYCFSCRQLLARRAALPLVRISDLTLSGPSTSPTLEVISVREASFSVSPADDHLYRQACFSSFPTRHLSPSPPIDPTVSLIPDDPLSPSLSPDEPPSLSP